MKPHVTSMMPCAKWLEELNKLHADDLDAEARMQLNEHLETCERCQTVKAEYAAIDGLILGLPRARPLPTLPARLQNAMELRVETKQPLTNDDKQQDAAKYIPMPVAEPVHIGTIWPRKNLFARRLNQAVAVLVVAALLGSFLLLFSTRQMGNGNTASGHVNATRLYLITAGSDGRTNLMLSALNANGHVLWQRPLDSTLLSYGVSNKDNLYLPAQDGNAYAFRGRDGQALWHSSISHGSQDATFVQLLAYQNLIIDTITNTKNDNGDLYALDAQTGKVAWHTTISCVASSSSDCAAGGRLMFLANGAIYGLASDGISAWNAGDGRLLWHNGHYLLNGQPQAMAVAQGKIYITNFYPEVDVLDVNSGRFLHSLRIADSNDSSAVVYDIAASGDTIFVLGGRTVFAYRASDDSLLWKQSFNYHSGGTIYVSSSSVYVSYYDIYHGQVGPGTVGKGPGNNLYALRLSDGQQIWHDQHFPGSGNMYPVEFNDVLCFSGLKSVYGFGSKDGKQLWQFSNGADVQNIFGG